MVGNVLLKKYRKRNGRCYEIGGNFILDNSDWVLVHATLIPFSGPFTDQKYEHCFLEKGSTVYDPILDKTYDKDEYYAAFRVIGAMKYNQKSAAKKMIKNHHWGPWIDTIPEGKK